MTNSHNTKGSASRRSFLKKGLAAGGGAAMGAGLLAKAIPALGQDDDGRLTRGDAAILRFLTALEIIESDLWLQYNELGGIQGTKEVPGGTGSQPYITALSVLDPDMPQYIHDNTEDEISHFHFLNDYLDSKGEAKVDMKMFRNLQGSMATGSAQKPRITNLLQLTVDTSWWTRYRSRAQNPDLDPGFQFPQAIPALSMGQFPAIPVTDADLSPTNHIQAIASTAGFHFGFIEQGGSSLYPSLAQRVTSPEVLRILLSIGPTETSHFQTWHDKAGNAPAITDPNNPKLIFPNLNASPFGGEDFQTNLIMPEPCPFLNRKFHPVSIIRPTETNGAAMGALKALTADGLFIGQTPQFFEFMRDLAEDADAARSGQ
ncbi:MAG TPA: ferritin-like domain-containing protein [Terriglobia bacterium]|nr:ferritin-like domain-containing protein [Terriglobia bacterium]